MGVELQAGNIVEESDARALQLVTSDLKGLVYRAGVREIMVEDMKVY